MLGPQVSTSFGAPLRCAYYSTRKHVISLPVVMCLTHCIGLRSAVTTMLNSIQELLQQNQIRALLSMCIQMGCPKGHYGLVWCKVL